MSLDVSKINNEPHPFFVVDYVPKKASFLENHVKWLNKDRKGLAKIGAVALKALEILALTLSIVGIPFLIKACTISARMRKEEEFARFASQKAPPQEEEEIFVKSPTRSFNHVAEYAIENDVIWTRKRSGENRKWQPVYFKGFPDKVPEQVDADGANLIVLSGNELHYKKVLKEYRKKELDLANNPHFAGKTVDQQAYNYFAVDKSPLNNWKSAWFSLPYIAKIVNVFAGKQLKIPSGIKSLAVSHRGRYNSFTEDRDGQRHSATIGVTTLYALENDGTKIKKFDPWSPAWANIYVYLPETETSVFAAESIAASASTIMAIGYEKEVATGNEKLKILTKLSDIDTEGNNPFLKYAFFKDANDKDKRVLPVQPEWQEHEIPEDAKVLTKEITIVQTGEGNDAREMRIAAVHTDGTQGYFIKGLKEQKWRFVSARDQSRELKAIESTAAVSRQPSVKSYQGGSLNIRGSAPIHDVRMERFGNRKPSSTIAFQLNGKEYQLQLYRRYTWWNFLGVDRPRYDVVIPEQYHNDKGLEKIFGAEKEMEVKFRKTKKQFTISSKENTFTFTFPREQRVQACQTGIDETTLPIKS